MSDQISILIVDDHSVVRQGVRAFLAAQSGLHIVGEAGSGEEAVLLTEKLVPDIVLMDLLLPGMSGVEAIRQIKQISPHTQVVVLTSYYEDEHIFPALRAGAISYALKDIRSSDLVEIVRKASRGESALHSRIASRVIQEVRDARRSIPPAFADLTERELDVLYMLSEGYSNRLIAEKLMLSENTVKGYVSNILQKLHMLDRTQVAVFAWQQGLMNESRLS